MIPRSDNASLQDELGQVIANSFFGMEAGYMPTETFELPTPSSGDLQIAFDILASSVIRRIQAEALRDVARDLYHEMRRGMVDPVKYIELGAVRIEREPADE